LQDFFRIWPGVIDTKLRVLMLCFPYFTDTCIVSQSFYFYSCLQKDLVLHWYWALGVESIELILLANFVIQILGAKNTMAYPSNHENIRIGKEGAIPGYMGFVPGVRSHVVGHSFADACKRGLAISDSQRHNSFEKTIHLVCTDLCWKNKYPI